MTQILRIKNKELKDSVAAAGGTMENATYYVCKR